MNGIRAYVLIFEDTKQTIFHIFHKLIDIHNKFLLSYSDCLPCYSEKLKKGKRDTPLPSFILLPGFTEPHPLLNTRSDHGILHLIGNGSTCLVDNRKRFDAMLP